MRWDGLDADFMPHSDCHRTLQFNFARLYWLKRFNKSVTLWHLPAVTSARWNSLNLTVLITNRWLAAAGYLQLASRCLGCPVPAVNYPWIPCSHVQKHKPRLCEATTIQKAGCWSIEIFSANQIARCSRVTRIHSARPLVLSAGRKVRINVIVPASGIKVKV